MKKRFTKSFLTFLIFLVASDIVVAQTAPPRPDSSKIYRDIERFSKKSKSTNFIYRIFFKPVEVSSRQKVKSKKKVKVPSQYSQFEGKIIRDIFITTLDPFGYSVLDTTVASMNFFYKAGNGTHVKSQRITIRNLLLFRKNQPFDSLLVLESERLIRSQKFVHEVSFRAVEGGKNSDSVDIYIRELDNWSIVPKASISMSGFSVDLTDKNFLGLGHTFQNVFNRNFSEGNAYATNYFIPNIRNTYINTTFHYAIDRNENFTRGLAVERPFFSPFAKWAAGVAAATEFKKDSMRTFNSEYVPVNLRFRILDYWAGSAHRIFKGNTENARITNLTFTARVLQIRYTEKPSALYDTLNTYSNENFYMGSIGISSRKYVQDKYLFRYGVTEDVAVGKIYSVTAGYQEKNTGRLYLGMQYSYGNYTKWGYLSVNFELGSFYRSSHPEQGIFSAGMVYFTDLLEIGNWKFRQFIKPLYTMGLNRIPSENITLNEENGIGGFSSSSLTGTKKLVLTLQSQSYAPWNLIGFRLGPYVIYSLGLLGDDATGFKHSKVYSQVSVGVLIKNEFLVFDVLQFSVSFYPLIPGDGENIFKINSNSTRDFSLMDFAIGKPAPVRYR